VSGVFTFRPIVAGAGEVFRCTQRKLMAAPRPSPGDDSASAPEWASYRPGSPEDFDRLYRETYPRLKRTLTAVLGDPAAAEDCVQDAFIRAFGAWKRWRPDAPPEVWLHRIALNRALSYRRKRALQDVGEVLRRLGRPEPPPEPGAQVEWMALKGALSRLPTKLAAAIVLRHYHGYTNRELALVMGVSERTVGARLEAARHRLRRHLGIAVDKDLPTSSRDGVLLSEGRID
jgi:RNA polymerase sigma-70 factor (ECF subfamily)